MATWKEIGDAARAKILEAIESPKPSYSIGEYKVDWNAWIKHQMDIAKHADEMANVEEPSQEITYFTDEWL